MAFSWFISVIQLQFDLIQTSDVCDLLPTKGTVSPVQTANGKSGGVGLKEKAVGEEKEEMGGEGKGAREKEKRGGRQGGQETRARK